MPIHTENADRIFDAFDELSRLVHLKEKRRRKLIEVREIEASVCGHCNFWMARECKPEKEHGDFKSMNSIACADFQGDEFSKRLGVQRRTELAEIEASLHTEGRI